ncbi:type IV secretory system conjugative DNA transfer family protein [bacterium]|nr:MAG: type IV secretory system conjugative DNA transfer family protein [bacterium]
MQEFIDTILNGPARYAHEQQFSPVWTLVFVLSALIIEFAVVIVTFLLIVKLVQYHRTFLSVLLRRVGVGKGEVEYQFLQLTFPSDTTKSAYATEQLHILMRSMVRYRTTRERLAARKQSYSLELVATRDEGIRYMMRIPARDIELVKRTLLSFLPGLKITEVEEYLPDTAKREWGMAELQLAEDFVVPLADNKALEEHDPIAYLTGHMRNLLPDELIAVQIVTVPVFINTHPNEMRHIRDVRSRIALRRELGSKLTVHKINIPRIISYILLAPLWLFWYTFKVIEFIATASSKTTTQSTQDSYEAEVSTAVRAKLDQQLFEVSIRVLVVSSAEVSQRVNAIVSSFSTFSSANQSITLRRKPFFISAEKLLMRFRERTLTRHIASQQTILSSAELADLYHFPNTDLTKTEGLVKSRSRELAAPLSIKRGESALDVIVGANAFGGEIQEVGMTLSQRQRHTYVIGKTGTGKTTLLKSSIYQDMVNGKGLAVLDPHGDMFRELLSIVPEHRRDDVVVFDPSDRDYPVGLNILDPGIEFENEDDKQEWITSAVLSIFTKLADEKQWGPRMEHILRNTTLTALQLENPSLYTLQRLLTDKKYQKEVATTLKDPVLQQFWEKEFTMMGSMQMSAATAPLTHRLGHFITAKMSRHILLQEKSTIRIADIMNEGKILLVNLSKGDIGEDQSEFFGTILTALIWMAAYQRTKIPEKKRRDFFVYVDEFQNFATPQFGAITSEGRKFHVSLIVSHQNIAQMEDKDLVKVIAGNAATIICFKANPEDEGFILPYMRPEVEMGDIVNLAPYHFYMKVATEDSEEAFSAQTVPLDIEESQVVQTELVANSRSNYGTPKAKVEEYMMTLFEQPKAKEKEKPKVYRKKAGSGVKDKKSTRDDHLHGL